MEWINVFLNCLIVLFAWWGTRILTRQLVIGEIVRRSELLLKSLGELKKPFMYDVLSVDCLEDETEYKDQQGKKAQGIIWSENPADQFMRKRGKGLIWDKRIADQFMGKRGKGLALMPDIYVRANSDVVTFRFSEKLINGDETTSSNILLNTSNPVQEIMIRAVEKMDDEVVLSKEFVGYLNQLLSGENEGCEFVRIVLNFIGFIDRKKVLNFEEKKEYIDYFITSDIDKKGMQCLFLYGLSSLDNSAVVRKFARKYSFWSHLGNDFLEELFQNSSHSFKDFIKDAYGYEAFNIMERTSTRTKIFHLLIFNWLVLFLIWHGERYVRGIYKKNAKRAEFITQHCEGRW